MSGQANQAALPDPKVAYDHLFGNVHAQVFFGRLAQRGYAPQNEKQAQDLFGLAGRLRAVEEAEKTAGDDSPFSGALSALDGFLGQNGYADQAATQEHAMAIKEASAELAQDPAIYNSVLALKAFEAEQIAQQLQGQG